MGVRADFPLSGDRSREGRWGEQAGSRRAWQVALLSELIFLALSLERGLDCHSHILKPRSLKLGHFPGDEKLPD